MPKLLLFALLLTCWTAMAQNNADTLFLTSAISASVKEYKDVIRGQTSLYNGSEYREPRQTNDEENPFFESTDWVFGDVVYDKKFFDHVPLLYDITTDRVITENYYSAQQIALVSEKLSRFTFGNHTFLRETNSTLPKTGFYELLYDGTSKSLARRQKVIRETIVSQKLEVKFDPKNRYYVLKNGKYFPVKSKGSVLKLFEDEKPALRQFIKKARLKFASDPAHNIALVAAQYDQIKAAK
jgi:hypothetical protein